MSLDTLNNGDSGLAARTKINAAIEAVNGIAPTPGLPRGYIAGCVMVYMNGTSLQITSGVCRDDTDTHDIALTTITKLVDTAFAAGTGNGGLQTGLTIATNTNYSVWAIKDSSSGDVDVMFSTSATAPTLPGTYDVKRRIGWVRNTTAGIGIQGFIQKGDHIFVINPGVDSFGQTLNPASNDTLITLVAPPNVMTTFRFYGTATTGTWLVHLDASAAAANMTVSNLNATIGGSGTSNPDACQVRLFSGSSSQIRARASGTTVSFTVSTISWEDNRDRDD